MAKIKAEREAAKEVNKEKEAQRMQSKLDALKNKFN